MQDRFFCCIFARLSFHSFLANIFARQEAGQFDDKNTKNDSPPLDKNWEIFIIIYVFLIYFRYFH